MKVNIVIQNWRHIESKDAVVFVLGKLKEQIESGMLRDQMHGNHYDENGIEYQAKVKA